MTQVVTLTMNPALDKSASAENVMPEHKIRCRPPKWQAGGGGINVARVVHRLGGRPLSIFPSGGHCGELLSTLLLAEGVPSTTVPVAGTTRESLAIFEETTGQQYRFSFPGPTLSSSETARCADVVMSVNPDPDYLVLSGGLPPGVPDDFYAQLTRRAKEKGMRVIVDTTGIPLQEALGVGVFLIKPNIRELSLFAGCSLETDQEQQSVVTELVQSGQAQVVILSLGAAGLLFASADGCRYLRAPVVPIRSKVGAGDSTVGGIVWSLTSGRTLLESVQYGVAAGAACVMTPGTELCYKNDVERLFRSIQLT